MKYLMVTVDGNMSSLPCYYQWGIFRNVLILIFDLLFQIPKVFRSRLICLQTIVPIRKQTKFLEIVLLSGNLELNIDRSQWSMDCHS